MKIAFLTNEYAGLGFPDGGLGNYLHRITALLCSRGHECHVVYVNPWKHPDGPTRRRVGDVWVHVPPLLPLDQPPLHRARSQHARRVLGMGWIACQELSRLHEESRFDVVQATNMTSAALFVDIDVPVVLRLSAYYLWWREHDAPEPSLYDLYFESLERRVILAADAVYAPSAHLSGRLLRERGCAVDVIRPPAALDVDARCWDEEWLAASVAVDKPYVVILGSLAARKGTDFAARALRRVWQRHPDLFVHVVGQDSGQLSHLERAAEVAPGRLVFHGSQPHARVYPLLARARALILASPVENTPNTALEAGMLGTPIVCVRDSGSDELVPASELASQLLCAWGDDDGLAACIERAAELGSSERGSLGQATCQHIRSLLDPDSAATELENYFQRAVRHARRARPPARAVLELAIDDANGHFWRAPLEADVELNRGVAYLLWEASRRGWRHVVVVGAGALGAEVCRASARFGVEVLALADNNADLWGRRVANVFVESLELGLAREADGVLIASTRYAVELAGHVRRAQFRNGRTLDCACVPLPAGEPQAKGV